ncbi:MAG: cysteine--tRNA ligase [Bacteroidota bacterium]|nr:cysteine--tRNA ligase [Bacteroidota bacterium]
MLEIHNTLSGKKEEFKPLEENKIKFYVCGPTVYDYFHIGNARSFIMSDIIRKYLELKGYEVTFVMNLTDVDDKIIKKSIQEKVTSKAVAEKYVDAFLEDIEKLKVKRASFYPKATEHIYEIINLIKKLEAKGIAYNIDGNVFYDVSKFENYGALSKKRTEDLESGARIEINEEKKNALDFSLWKKAKEGEPFWESPWGNGRPGWHIECSAMSCSHLGETFDIHAGGNDLIFPHHENEIAQSEGASGKKFVNYWIHFGFLNINNEKMSKSLGNFFTARDILKIYSAETIRFFFAQTHFAGPLNFSEDLLQAAAKGLEKIQNLYDRVLSELNSEKNEANDVEFDFQKYFDLFSQAMDDNFNTPQAAAVIFDFVKEVNRVISQNENISGKFYGQVKLFLDKTAEGVLGIINTKASTTTRNLENELIELLLNVRLEAKQQKNYALSDKIRDDLKALGVILQDGKEKTTFKIVRE